MRLFTSKKGTTTSQHRRKLFFVFGFLSALLLMFGGNQTLRYTSTDEFCMSCHVHQQSESAWKLSPHFKNSSGVTVHCVECHLPHEGFAHISEKTKLGVRDLYATWFTDTKKINWDEKGSLENAVNHVFKQSCIHCHQNLFPVTLSQKGSDAHLYYEANQNDLHCINCHIDAGHYAPNRVHKQNTGFGATASKADTLYQTATSINEFGSFTETVPQTPISFRMISVKGGSFTYGSPDNEPFRNENENQPTEVKVASFFMSEIEINWDMYMQFFKETESEGRKEISMLNNFADSIGVDAITGPTPPFGNPDQGWGMGNRPAVTMTHYAAQTFCVWLSAKTGKKYRLPTEIEWEYACRAGSTSPYFFEGNPKDFSDEGFWNAIFGADTTVISSYIVYKKNSENRTATPDRIKANDFGLKNMSGNVWEFCSNAYENSAEFVIRGGSFKSDAAGVRSAVRSSTQTSKWQKTDPQLPKSIWWYSDCNDVGFRVVCEWKKKKKISK